MSTDKDLNPESFCSTPEANEDVVGKLPLPLVHKDFEYVTKTIPPISDEKRKEIESIKFQEPPPGYPSNVCVFEPLKEPVVGQYVLVNMLIVGPTLAKVTQINLDGKKAYAETTNGGIGFLLTKQENGHWWCQTSINLKR